MNKILLENSSIVLLEDATSNLLLEGAASPVVIAIYPDPFRSTAAIKSGNPFSATAKLKGA